MSADSEEKKLLRQKMKEMRASDQTRSRRDAALCERFFGMPLVGEKRSFFIYRSFGSEADTLRISERLVSAGKEVYFPRVEGREMVAVRWVGQAFEKNRYGILEPQGEAYAGQPEVCVLPLLAADKSLYRLGYGGGFYDRYLSDKEKTYKIGLCYDYQLVERVAREAHDIPLDALVTDERVLIRRVN